MEKYSKRTVHKRNSWEIRCISLLLTFILAVLPAFTGLSGEAGVSFAAEGALAKVKGLSLKVSGMPRAKLTWEDVDGEDGYRIYRNNKAIAEVGEDVASYLDTSLNPGESYTYTVRAYNKSGDNYTYGPAATKQEIRDGYTWKTNNGGGMTITGYTGRDTSLVTPETIDGGVVTEIGEECYRGNVWIKKVRVADSVKYISDYAFEACSAVKSVILPDSVESIGRCAFSGCANMTSITLNDEIKSIGDGAFLCCLALPSVDLPENLETLGEYAFAFDESLSTVNFDECNVTEIKDRTFYGCSILCRVAFPKNLIKIDSRAFGLAGRDVSSNIYIPKSVKFIGDYAFEQSENIYNLYDVSGELGKGIFYASNATNDQKAMFQTINKGAIINEGTFYGSVVKGIHLFDGYDWYDDDIEPEVDTDSGNTMQREGDGSIYSKDGKTLLAYMPYCYDDDSYQYKLTEDAENGIFSVPEGVERIASYAFYGCELKKVVLSYSVKEIGSKAFASSRLKASDVMPDSWQEHVSCADDAFYNENSYWDDPDEDYSYDDDDQGGDNQDRDDQDEDDWDEDEYKFNSLMPDDYSYDKSKYTGYLDFENGVSFLEWIEDYIDYNKDIIPRDTDLIPYIMLYKGETHYRQMTSVLNHDRYKTKQSIERSGEGYENMYLAMDHGLFAELERGLMPNNLVLYSGITPERVADLANVSRERDDVDDGSIAVNVRDELRQRILDGAEVTDTAVMSTTGSMSTAIGFGSFSQTIVRIYASQEALEKLGAVCIESFTQYGEGEEEILLNKDANYKLLDFGELSINYYGGQDDLKYTYVTLELLGKDESTELDGDEKLSDPVYKWADDYSTCTGTIYDPDDESIVTETETTDEVIYEVLEKPTLDKEGVGRYTAEFSSEFFETQTMEVTIPKLTDEDISARNAALEKLNDIIVQAKELMAEGKYSSETMKNLSDSISEANNLYNDETATEEDVNVARVNLLEAIRTLEADGKGYLEALKNLTDTLKEVYKSIDKNLYTPESYEEFMKVVSASEDVLSSANSTADDLKQAKERIDEARKKLVEKSPAEKAANTIKVKAKTATVKYSRLKKKKQVLSVKKVLTIKNARGKVAFKKVKGNKKILVNTKTGKITVKKGLKKGTYKVKVKIKAAGNSKYKAKTKTVTFKIRVK